MKKALLILSLCAAGSVFAGTAMVSGTAVTTGDCPLLNESVTPRLSNNVKGGWTCNEDNGYFGIGTAHEAGAGYQFEASNKGGTIQKNSCASVAANAQTCANTAADNASAT